MFVILALLSVLAQWHDPNPAQQGICSSKSIFAYQLLTHRFFAVMTCVAVICRMSVRSGIPSSSDLTVISAFFIRLRQKTLGPFVRPRLSFSYSRSPPGLLILICIYHHASQIRLFLPSLPLGVSSPSSITFICSGGSNSLSGLREHAKWTVE